MADTVKVLHAGNLALEHPGLPLRPSDTANRRKRTETVLQAMMDAVDETGALFVLFSGHLLDGTYAGDDTVRFLSDLFARRANCHFLISPGDLDPYTPDSPYASGRFPPNVHFFTERQLSRLDFDCPPVSVYGWNGTPGKTPFAPLAKKQNRDRNRLCLTVGFGRLTGEDEAGTFRLTAADAETFGADFLGLNDGEKPFSCFRLGRTLLAYSGHAAETDFCREEIPGYSLLTAVNAADGWEVSLERKTLPGYFYREVGFDVSGAADEQEAVRTVLRGLENLFPENRSQTVLKIRLSGAVTPDFRLSDGFAQSFSDFYAAVPEDATLPLLPPAGGYPFEAAKRLHQNALSAMAGGTEEEKRHNAAVFRAAYRALVYGEADMG